MKKAIAIALLAIALAGCGTHRHANVYTDKDSGLSVLVECDEANFDGAIQSATCSVTVLDR